MGAPATRKDATIVWARIGLLSFGGPAAQIALMHKALVEERGWLSERQFSSALNFCMMLPGPEAMQLATYSGWGLHGTWGGLIAGLLFILPGAVLIMALGALYAVFGQVPVVSGIFVGIQAAVIVIVLQALMRLSQRALKGWVHWCVASAAFVAIFLFNLPFPALVLFAALCGSLLQAPPSASDGAGFETLSFQNTARTTVLWLAIWLLPLALLAFLQAPSILIDAGLFFSKLAVVTFGGAYAVLTYMAQEVVAGFGWLDPPEMVDALGLAETTPGPLILVTQFVGFLAGFKEGGLVLGLCAALVALWATFAPCFLWIFACAPYVERISNLPRLQSALSGITAAVVGVILNLSIWFTVHVLFAQVETAQLGAIHIMQPVLTTFNWHIVPLLLICAAMLWALRWNVIWIILVAGALGAASITFWPRLAF